MNDSAERGLAAREQTIGALTAWQASDPRLVGLWLQGSLAAGGEDPWSDIDAYIAVEDQSLEAVWAERSAILEQLGGALAWSDGTTPALKVVHALMTSGARLDLFFEAAGSVGQAARPAVRFLAGDPAVSAKLLTGFTAPAAVIGRIVQVILRMTRQGSTWPLRLLGRGKWSTLAMMELDLINAQIAQLMATGNDAADFYRNPFSLHARLNATQQAEIDALTAEALAALTARDTARLKDIHLKVFDALGREGRRACAALGVEYPIGEDQETAIRDLLIREWPAAG